MSNFSRLKRIDEQLKQELSLLIRQEAHDPRIMMVSITQVETVRDFSQAKVYITYLGPTEERDEILEILGSHGGEFRRQLGKILRLRTIPKFFFVYDDLLEKSNELSLLISQAVKSDEKKAKLNNTDIEDESEHKE